jgi:hypothetical protein
MEKYNLSAKGLQSAFNKLIEKKAVTVEELYNRFTDEDDTVIIEDMRQLPRHYLTVSVPIYEPSQPGLPGQLRDITDRGLGVIGIESKVGEVKSFVIPCRKFVKLENIWFEAECLWVNTETKDDQIIAGFQITKISGDCMDRLRKLIKYVTFG